MNYDGCLSVNKYGNCVAVSGFYYCFCRPESQRGKMYYRMRGKLPHPIKYNPDNHTDPHGKNLEGTSK